VRGARRAALARVVARARVRDGVERVRDAIARVPHTRARRRARSRSIARRDAASNAARARWRASDAGTT
jgi:hypothetical protein